MTAVRSLLLYAHAKTPHSKRLNEKRSAKFTAPSSSDCRKPGKYPTLREFLCPAAGPSQSVGIVTGLVGAAGGLGGFFPPLLLGVVRQTFDSFMIGFICLAAFAVMCWFVLRNPRIMQSQHAA